MTSMGIRAAPTDIKISDTVPHTMVVLEAMTIMVMAGTEAALAMVTAVTIAAVTGGDKLMLIELGFFLSLKYLS